MSKLETVGSLKSGVQIYREPNRAGGHSYWSDSIGGGVMIWDTCLVSEEELLLAIDIDHKLNNQTQVITEEILLDNISNAYTKVAHAKDNLLEFKVSKLNYKVGDRVTINKEKYSSGRYKPLLVRSFELDEDYDLIVNLSEESDHVSQWYEWTSSWLAKSSKISKLSADCRSIVE